MIKLPKGTQDYDTKYNKLQFLINKIKTIFENHRGTFIETPIFELKSILQDKYGDEEKLIYHMSSKDQSVKEELSLRYDLTVPLVRYCSLNSIKKGRFARIGKVYRRETISKKKKRLREFYQADFDFVGEYTNLQPELEIFTMITKLLTSLNIDYKIQYNYRQNLEYYMDIVGIPKDKFNSVCSSIDKLDKVKYDYVYDELIEKGIMKDQIESLFDLIEKKVFEPETKKINDDFCHLLELSNIDNIKNIVHNSYLARGSDYYTGIIFEVKVKGYDSSIIGGGRYDNMSLGKHKLKMIGFSFGIDRILDLFKYEQPNKLSIYISQTSNFDKLLETKLKIISFVNNHQLYYDLKYRKLSKELHDAHNHNCNFMIIIGETELEKNKVIIRDMKTSHQTEINIDETTINYAICI
jgi:histidyl-tRNA synthetase